MPCSEPRTTVRDRRAYEACKLIIWLCNQLGEPIPPQAIEGQNSHYQAEKYLNPATEFLCSLCKRTPESIIYARSKPARELANWWEEHQEIDKNRGDKV